MTQPSKRNPARDKKMPKYMQYDDTQYGLHSAPRALQSKVQTFMTKQARGTNHEINQLARLLLRFVNNTNQNYRDHHAKNFIQASAAQELSRQEIQNSKDINRLNFQKIMTQEQKYYQNASNRKLRDQYQRTLIQQYKSNQKAQIKKQTSMLKTTMSTSQNQALSFKPNKKDNSTISNENSKNSLEQIGMHKFTKQSSQAKLAKIKQNKKKEGLQKQVNERQQFKLFKRQSYHVAIAYNIHIKQFHSGTHPSAKNIDPTFTSKKLRQMTIPS